MMKKIVVLLVVFILFACGKEKDNTIEAKEIKEILKPESKDIIQKDTLPSVTKNAGCSIMRQGTFKYKDPEGDDVIVKINGESITEEHKSGKYFLMSKIKWISDCEYENMFIMTTLPKFNLEPGTLMAVTIDKVEGKDIYFTATAKGKSYHSVFTKIK